MARICASKKSLRDRFLSLLAHGGDKLDWSAISQLVARDSGEMGG
jgi:hypothetical protein